MATSFALTFTIMQFHKHSVPDILGFCEIGLMMDVKTENSSN